MKIKLATDDSLLVKSNGFHPPERNNIQIIEMKDDVQHEDVGPLMTDYHEFLFKLLHEKHVTTVLDLACGTGDISVSLLEQGFKVDTIVS